MADFNNSEEIKRNVDDIKEIPLDLPWDIVDECNGFGLDFGGSVCKIIYLHKDDWKEAGERTGPTARLRCVNFSRTDFDQALAYLKDRVSIRRKSPDEKPMIYTTGLGGSQYASKIRDTFNICTSNITELECFVAGFRYALKHLNRGEIAHELDEDTVQKAVSRNKKMLELREKVLKDASNFTGLESTGEKELVFAQELPLEAEKKFKDYDNLFPCFMAMIGSNGGVFVLNEDGTYQFASEIKLAGRAFIGLGSILTGSKSYEEIMSKAEKGKMTTVHQYLTDVTETIDPEDDAENMYGVLKNADEDMNEPGFLFGKCVFKDIGDFSQEDLARSFLNTMVTEMAINIHLGLRAFPKVKHVFFVGGFPNHPLTRNLFIREWIEREGISFSLLGVTEFHHIHFLKHGSHFGAFGAYLNQKLKFKVAESK